MEKKIEIRLLRANEIECRIGTISDKGLSLLLYKDARVDQKILDETFTPFGWKRSHQAINNSLFCTVEIFNPATNDWISKQDVGSSGKNELESEKTQASDSFKRACFNLGIGRELYSAPFILIPSARVKIQKNGNKYSCYTRFSVKEISYDENREISALVIEDDNGKIVYQWRKLNSSNLNPKKKLTSPKKKLTSDQIKAYDKELERTGVTEDAVEERFHVRKSDEMAPETYLSIMSALKATKTKAA